MKDKILQAVKAITSYKALTILWLMLGISELVIGNISRLNYFCVWIVLMIELVFHALKEDGEKRK